jgi:hypothetical protein
MNLAQKKSNRPSSLRKQGPITTGFRGYERPLPAYPNESTRRMGPRFRGDDVLRLVARQNKLSWPALSFTSPRLRGEVGDGAQRRLWVRGTLRESCHAESPPHPNPPRASFARLDPASGARERVAPHTRLSSPGLTGRPSTPRRLTRHSGARVQRANPESRGTSSLHFEIPDRSALRTFRNDGEA